jgi:hypothetical protein
MDESSWDHNSHSASQETLLFMVPKGSLLYLQDPATGHDLSQMNAVHFLPPWFFKMDFNTVLIFTTGNKIIYSELSSVCSVTVLGL